MPFKSGLHKRKLETHEDIPSSNETSEKEENEEITFGLLDEGEEDETGEEEDEDDDQNDDDKNEDSESSDLTDSEDETEEENDNEQITEGEKRLKEFSDKIEEPELKTQPVEEKDEYESGDTSDEEERCNTVGDVPMWWYDEYPHIGYDLDGKRILKPVQRDDIDDFLKKCEDPDFWRTVRDPATGQDVVLSAADLELIARVRQARPPAPALDRDEPWLDWFTRDVLVTPLRAFPDHKRSFLPSDSERRQIARIVHALKMGWMKTRRQLAEERKKRKEKNFYDLWGSVTDDERAARGLQRHIAAPRRALPGHAESYNPPPEYLLDTLEMKEWEKLAETPWKRKYTFLPTRHESLRAVPAYERFVRERFLRCLDLYLAPRAIKMRLTIQPEDLVPKLPSPRELQPFPTGEVLRFTGHVGLVRGCDFDPSGEYVVSGGEDGTVKVWETASGRCLRTIACGEPVMRVAWTPAAGLSLVAAAAGTRLLLLNPGADVGAHRVAAATDELLAEPPPSHDVRMDERTASAARWERPADEEWERGVRVVVAHFRPLAHVAWHARGDYLAVTVSDGANRAVLVHQLSRRRSQLPFGRCKGIAQCALFHPTRPLLFVATQRAVRIYDLVKQELIKKLLPGAQSVSTMAVHPSGEHLLVGSYDRKVIWFDLQLSSKPYRTLRVHGGAVRALAVHRRYPLFASAGDDAHVLVSHGAVFADLLQNALLVPLRRLRAPPPPRAEPCTVLDLRFHPAQPWLLAATAHGSLVLYA